MADVSGGQFLIKGVDTAGNVSASGTALSVTIDTAAPAAPGAPDLQAGSDSGVSSDDNITNITTPTFDITSTDTYYRFFVDATQYGGDYLSSSSYTILTALTDGVKSVTIKAIDAAGNASADGTALSVTIDTVAPAAPGTPDLQAASDSGVSATDNITNITTPTFDITSTDTYFRFFVDGVQNGSNYLTGSSYTTSALTDGSKLMTLTAVDTAGNVSAASTALSVTIDTAAPAAPNAPDLQAASDTGISSTDDITSDDTPTFDVTSTDTYFRFFINGDQNGGNYLTGTTFTPAAALEDITNGQFLIKGVDAAGNVSADGTALTVTIDTTAPAPPGAPDLQAASDSGASNTDNITNITTLTFDITSTDTYFRFYINGVKNSTNWKTGGTYTTTAQAEMTNGQFLIRAVDAAGNVSDAGTALSVTIDTTAPATPGAPDLQAGSDSGVSSTDNITNDNMPTFDVTSTDDYYRFYVGGVQDGGNYLTGAFTTAALTDGAKSVTVKAVDAAGNVSGASDALSVTIDTTAPAAPDAPDLQAASDSGASNTDNITNDTTPTFTVVSTDTYYRFYVGGVQNGGNYLTGAYTTTALTDGDKSMTVTSVDAAGNESAASDALDVTIDTEKPESKLSSPADGSDGTNLQLEWTVNDNLGADSVASLDIYVSTNGGAYALAFGDVDPSGDGVTFTGAAGNVYRFYSRATDTAGNVEAASAQADVVISLQELVSLTGRRVSYTLTDENGTTVTINWTGPAGSSVLIEQGLDPATGTRGDIRNLTIAGSNASSILTIMTVRNRAIPGSDAETTVVNVYSDGPVGTISGPGVDLLGNMTIDGSLYNLTLDDINSDDQLITIGENANPRKSLNIKLDEVADLSITSGTAINKLKVTDWLNTDDDVDLITTPSIARLYAYGKRGVQGDFEADLNVSTLGSATIKGDLRNAIWKIEGEGILNRLVVRGSVDSGRIEAAQITTAKIKGSLNNATWNVDVLNSLTVRQWVNSSQILATERINTITVGGTTDSDFYAGVNGSFTGRPDSYEDAQDPNIESVIGKFTVTRAARNKDGYSTIDTNIAAMQLNNISLQYAKFANNGTRWGLESINQPGKFTYGDVTGKYVWPNFVDDAGDFEVMILQR